MENRGNVQLSSTVCDSVPLEQRTADAISEIELSSRLAFENGAYYVTTPLVAPGDDGQLGLMPVGFVLSTRVLLTVRFGPLPSFDAAHEAFAAQQARTAEEAFLRILEIVVRGLVKSGNAHVADPRLHHHRILNAGAGNFVAHHGHFDGSVPSFAAQ